MMGIFFYVNSVALAEDVPIDHEKISDTADFYNLMDAGYKQVKISLIRLIFISTDMQMWAFLLLKLRRSISLHVA